MHRPISRKTTLAGLAAAGVLGLGIAAPAVAFAADGSPAPSGSSSPASPSTASPSPASPSTAPGQRGAAFAAALAKELGVSQDKVTAALQKLRDQHRADHPNKPGTGPKTDRATQLKQRLDQAVKDGKLTQAEADAITKAVDAGVLPGRGWWAGQWQHRTGARQDSSGQQDRSGHRGGHGQWRDHGQRRDADRSGFAAALAKELGVSQDKVTAALQKLRDQHRADHPSKPGTGPKTDRATQLKQRLDQAVKDGKLTQAEADAITKAFETLAAQWSGQHAQTK